MSSDSPDHKRQLRTADARAAAMPSTADIYGAKHGIPEDVQAALQNVGRRNRMSEWAVLRVVRSRCPLPGAV